MTRTDTYLRFALLATTVLSALPAGAGDILPTGASVAYGSVGITTPAANAMSIQQSSPNAIVNWRGFSIGEGARVDIHQPSSSSAILNRVTSSTPSTIAGQLNANGQVYLLNPNGILIHKSGTVRTGAFVASTLAMTDEDFTAGRRNLFGNGRSAAVVNQGTIEVGRGGYAALVGGKVENSGTITAPVGSIGLGAGEQATLDLSGDGFLQVTVPSEETPGDDGALITNTGRLVADGGRIELKAATARQMARDVINLSGIAQARTVSGVSGAIVLGGGSGGRVRVTGKLDASAPRQQAEELVAVTPPPPRPDRGGSIVVSGDSIELASATLDASGPGGGGSVRVGGDYQGKGDLQRARTTSVDAASLITADALGAGDGGRVIVWSDERTSYEGTIRARGGPDGGDGGFAEVSGKDRLWFAGAADLSAPSGTVGTLLVDPTDISIVEDPDPDSNEIAAETVETILSDVSFTVSTASDDPEVGNITVEAPLEWAGINTLTLDADNDILINAAIAAPDGGLTLTADAGATSINAPILIAELSSTGAGPTTISAPITTGDGGSLVFGADEGSIEVTGAISLGDEASLVFASGADLLLGADITWGTFSEVFALANDITIAGALSGPAGQLDLFAEGTITADGPIEVNLFALLAGHWIQVADPLPAFSAADFRIDEGQGGDASFLRALGGDGTAAAPWLIADPFGLQGIGSAAATDPTLPDLSDAYALANDIDATGTAGWNNVEVPVGVAPIGALLEAPFTGSLDGQGFQITGLFIDRPSTEGVGLFADMAGSVTNLSLTGIDITGGVLTGGLAGTNAGTITQAHVTGSVHGISSTVNDVQVNAGGLLGQNFGTVGQSTSTATVVLDGLGGNLLHAGGFVGQNDGTISQSFATGTVEANGSAESIVAIAGGFVGLNSGAISEARAEGTVNGSATDTQLGGFVGNNTGDVSNSYWSDGGIQGGSDLDADSPDGDTIIGGFVGVNEGGVENSYTTVNQISWVGTEDEFVDFLVGQDAGGTITETYSSPGPADSFNGWDFDNVWAPLTPGFDPELYAISPVVRVDVNDDFRQYGDNNPPLTSTNFGGPASFVFGPPGDTLDTDALLTTPAVPSSPIGDYEITTSADTATSSGGIEYRLITTDGTLTVGLAPLTIIADDQSKTYGTDFVFDGTEFTIDPTTPLFFEDNVDTATITSLGAPGTAGAGTYAIDIIDAVGTGLENYAIAYVPGIFTVNLADLTVTVTANDQVKTYGSDFRFDGTEFSVEPDQLLNNDAVTSATITSLGAPRTATVGTYAIDIGDAEGTGLENYDIDYVAGEFVVNLAPLTITANDQTKTYGTDFVFDGSEFTLDPAQLFNDDQVTSAKLESLGARGTAPVAGSPYAILASDAEGAGLSNYVINYDPGALTVHPKSLRVTADDRIKLSDQDLIFEGTEFTAEGLVNGDRITSVRLESPGAPATAPASGSPYTITASDAQGEGLSSNGVSNYDFVYEPGDLFVVSSENPIEEGTFDAGLRLSFATDLANPSDVIEISDTEGFEAASGGGPTLGTGEDASAAAQDTLAFVQGLSTQLDDRVATCDPSPGEVDPFLGCVRDALADYARELDARILDLPAPLRAVSAVIQQSAQQIEGVRVNAARRIAAATSDEEIRAIEREAAAQASAAVRAAVVEIRNAIELIRAEDDPQLASLQVEQGTTITAALQNVEDELARAVGL